MPSSSSSSSSSSSFPWQVLVLVANHLDPKTLAIASCVSKSWLDSMSSDHLWEKICTTHFPSLTHLRSAAAPTLPYHRLYALGLASAKRRQQPPKKPKLTLESLIFTITITNSRTSMQPVTMIKPGSALSLEPQQGLFKFDFDVGDHNKWLGFEVLEDMQVTWNVVLGGFEGVFTMMKCRGKGSFVSGSDGWFSAELPSPGGCCCASAGTSGLVADLRLGMREVVSVGDGDGDGGNKKKKMVVERVSVGVLSIVTWRYVSMDDGLRYLQHFLCQ